MERFANILGRINEQLTLPQPHKYRVMKELADDLEDLYEYYLSAGDSEETAARKAEEKIDADPETLRLLIKLNESPVSTFIRRFSQQSRRRFETALWIVLALTIGIPILIFTTTTTDGFTPPGLFFWPVFGLTIAGAVVSFRKTVTLYICKTHRFPHVKSGISVILFLGWESFLLGLTGFVYEIMRGTDNIAHNFALVKSTFPAMVETSLSVLFLGALSAAILTVTWLIFTMKIADIEEHEKAFLFRT